MYNLAEQFGSLVFDNRTMRERLPKDVYKTLQKTIHEGKSLGPGIAGVVANAMKDWAVEKGATHYTHWFQPLTGITAEKHDSFISPSGEGGIIMEFSGRELIKGEPDASSFPSGGLRATFEARGYTAWDPTSYAFIKENTLCIPTAFCSYSGEALDKKTPLLRSMECLSKQAVRILKLFGKDTAKVTTTVGPEQEYFLVDKKLFNKREDLMMCGRTLFGAKPPKGQELEDHYFGALRPRVLSFMKELNEELWKLGVLAKTEHNEAAPAQHELAPIYSTTNIAADHNQLTMEFMKKVADRHGLACLLHEKPFAGVNGSGKHNNWSMCTLSGENLLDPGDDPIHNHQFLVFLAAVLKAVDNYQDLLRVSVASAGNDHRLGANEAPPTIVSVFLGDELTAVVESLENGNSRAAGARQTMKSGVDTIPDFEKDNTDRNRTSPFAFTGNKFEFRMLGSSVSVSDANIILNTIVADALEDFADRLEKAKDLYKEITALVRETIVAHKRIIFNGNNYAGEWVIEAERRGLLNLRNTVEALPCFISEKNVSLFTRHGILTETEVHSRYEILMENYCKTINIEALTMLDMVKKDIIPAVCSYTASVSETALKKKQLLPDAACVLEKSLIIKLSALTDSLYRKIEALDSALLGVKDVAGGLEGEANYFHGCVFAAMQELRAVTDEMEALVGKNYWPFPTYIDLLYSV